MLGKLYHVLHSNYSSLIQFQRKCNEVALFTSFILYYNLYALFCIRNYLNLHLYQKLEFTSADDADWQSYIISR